VRLLDRKAPHCHGPTHFTQPWTQRIADPSSLFTIIQPSLFTVCSFDCPVQVVSRLSGNAKANHHASKHLSAKVKTIPHRAETDVLDSIGPSHIPDTESCSKRPIYATFWVTPYFLKFKSVQPPSPVSPIQKIQRAKPIQSRWAPKLSSAKAACSFIQ
jgi:hypothetical protein